MAQEIIVKTYKGSHADATAAFQRDALAMSQHGYYPVAQSWTAGSYGCADSVADSSRQRQPNLQVTR
jgi:hypothetical protein